MRKLLAVALALLLAAPASGQSIGGGGGGAGVTAGTGVTVSGSAVSVAYGTTAGTAAQGNDPRFSTVSGGAGGSNGQLQYNASGSLAGSAATLTSGGTLTIPSGQAVVNNVNGGVGFDLNSAGSNYGQFENVDSHDWCLGYGGSLTVSGTCDITWSDNAGETLAGTVNFSGTINFKSGSTIVLQLSSASTASLLQLNATGVMGWTSSSNGSASMDTGFSRDTANIVDLGTGAQGNKGGTLNLATLTAATKINLPDGGNCSTTICKFESGLLLEGTTAPALVPGSGAAWIDTTITSGCCGAGITVAHGLVFQGDTNSGCTGASCENEDMEFRASDGFTVIAFENGGNNHNAQFGIGREASSAAGIAQLIFSDIMTSGSVGPSVVFALPDESVFAGFGENSTSASDQTYRFGATSNFNTAWDNRPASAVALLTDGAIQLGTGTGTTATNGTVTCGEQIVDAAGTLSVTACNTPATPAPIAVSLVGVTPATWADNHACTAGQVTVDASYIYVCTATNTVKRAALSAF